MYFQWSRCGPRSFHRGLFRAISSYGASCSKVTEICENGSTLKGYSSCTVNNPIESILFASQYDKLSSPINDAWTRTKEGGLVYVAAGWNGGVQDQAGLWDYGWYETSAVDVAIRQSYGKQWAHDSPLDDNSTIYVNVKAPRGGSLNVSNADTLVIQMGNGAKLTNKHPQSLYSNITWWNTKRE